MVPDFVMAWITTPNVRSYRAVESLVAILVRFLSSVNRRGEKSFPSDRHRCGAGKPVR